MEIWGFVVTKKKLGSKGQSLTVWPVNVGKKDG